MGFFINFKILKYCKYVLKTSIKYALFSAYLVELLGFFITLTIKRRHH